MSSSDGLGFFDSIILGIVQGLTEFFPVSSDGHLAVFQHLLGYHKENMVFDVLLHAGTLGALLLVFRKETVQLIHQTVELFKTLLREKSLRLMKSPSESERPTIYVWWVTFVTGIFGLCLEKAATASGQSILATGFGFLITASFLLWASVRRNNTKAPSQQSWVFPLLIGVAQSSALLSGVSRSGMTISTALLLGCRRDEAGRFSFVAAIPIIFMAILYELRKLDWSQTDQLSIMLVGVLVSFVTGVMAIKGLLAMLTRLSLRPFAYYCIALGLLCLAWSFAGESIYG
jgi:undecaprenyl-diphosphatase